jgi:hypothetical protein
MDAQSSISSLAPRKQGSWGENLKGLDLDGDSPTSGTSRRRKKKKNRGINTPESMPTTPMVGGSGSFARPMLRAETQKALRVTQPDVGGQGRRRSDTSTMEPGFQPEEAISRASEPQLQQHRAQPTTSMTPIPGEPPAGCAEGACGPADPGAP